jgi:hypothetical protein
MYAAWTSTAGKKSEVLLMADGTESNSSFCTSLSTSAVREVARCYWCCLT